LVSSGIALNQLFLFSVAPAVQILNFSLEDLERLNLISSDLSENVNNNIRYNSNRTGNVQNVKPKKKKKGFRL